jgi:hypothetical protein
VRSRPRAFGCSQLTTHACICTLVFEWHDLHRCRIHTGCGPAWPCVLNLCCHLTPGAT